jgi:hypothetical protein
VIWKIESAKSDAPISKAVVPVYQPAAKSMAMQTQPTGGMKQLLPGFPPLLPAHLTRKYLTGFPIPKTEKGKDILWHGKLVLQVCPLYSLNARNICNQ